MSYSLLTELAYAISIGYGIYHVLSSALCRVVKPKKQLPFFFKVDQAIVMYCVNISLSFLSAVASK